MSKISDRHCEVCLRKGIRKKARTLCDECREFYCKECSDNHLLYKATQNHTLIDLDPPGEEPRSASEDELASDFLEYATVSETTVLYRAQVAVESGPSNIKQEQKDSKEQNVKKNEDVDISKVKPKKVTEFSVKRQDDEENVDVNGVLALGDKVIIVDNENKNLKLFGSNSGNYLSSTDLKESTYGITHVKEDRFATCGFGNKIFFWTLRGQSIICEDEEYDVDHDAHGIHCNNTYYCVLHRHPNAVTILDRQGRQVRKIVMKEAFGKKIEFGRDIHMDNDTHNVYIPCWEPDGVLCMSVEGECLWFVPMSGALWGITEVHGALCVANVTYRCLHLISKTGKVMGKLLEKEELSGVPYCIYFNEQEDKLYISHNIDTEKRDIISVYSVL